MTKLDNLKAKPSWIAPEIDEKHAQEVRKLGLLHSSKKYRLFGSEGKYTVQVEHLASGLIEEKEFYKNHEYLDTSRAVVERLNGRVKANCDAVADCCRGNCVCWNTRTPDPVLAELVEWLDNGIEYLEGIIEKYPEVEFQIKGYRCVKKQISLIKQCLEPETKGGQDGRQ